MTAVPTAPVICTNPPIIGGKPMKRSHHPTWLSGWCGTNAGGEHDRCPGVYRHPCGCTVPCRCAAPGHPADHPHPYQEDPVPLPSPFSVPPDPKAAEHPEAVVTPPVVPVPGAQPLPETVEDWTAAIVTKRPWIDGTGEGGAPLEVMVRAFAMAAGDLHLSDDDWTDYDETALTALLGILRASVRRAALLDELLVSHLHKHHPWGKRIIDGVGEVRTYRRESRVHWDERGTAEAIIHAHLDGTDGELPDPSTVVTWLLEAAAVDYYRKTALRALGIDPQDYYTSEKGTLAVDVPVPD